MYQIRIARCFLTGSIAFSAFFLPIVASVTAITISKICSIPKNRYCGFCIQPSAYEIFPETNATIIPSVTWMCSMTIANKLIILSPFPYLPLFNFITALTIAKTKSANATQRNPECACINASIISKFRQNYRKNDLIGPNESLISAKNH